MTRVLGVDPGATRVGLALSDPGRTFASPLDVVPASEAAKAIREVIAEHEVGLVVVGHPVGLDGGTTAATMTAESLADELRESLEVGVELYDERLTTVTARRAMKEAGISEKQMRNKVDSVAAAVLLQSFLDARR